MSHFVHEPLDQDATVAAIATPPGEGGVAVIRISGKEALLVAGRVFSRDVTAFETHTVHFGRILDAGGEPLDDVLLLLMKGPRSFTGEDTVEIHCHGGALVTKAVLQRILEAGAKAAKPGQFTLKAFLNGKIDLSQAEAIQELICANNELAMRAAEDQLRGSLSQKVANLQDRLVEVAAILEAWVDFPEEGLEFTTMDELLGTLKGILEEVRDLSDTYHDGRIVHDGVTLCLAGTPNVGKSSLLNALANRERAIVTALPGTTRDLVEEHLRLGGLNLKLIDTAGIRETAELVEQEGIRRSKQAMESTDLVLLVLDASRGLSKEDRQLLHALPPEKTIIVWNKMDLPHEKPLPSLPFRHIVFLSAKEKTGLDDLRQAIDSIIWDKGPPAKGEVLITSLRHKEALDHCLQAGERVVQGLLGEASPEFLTLDMRQALGQLGLIIGRNISEDILTEIFKKFCIGK